jgi:hypothetical protein
MSEYYERHREGWIMELGLYDELCFMQVHATILFVVYRVICDHVLVCLHPVVLHGLMTWAFSRHGVFDRLRTEHDGHTSAGWTTTVC